MATPQELATRLGIPVSQVTPAGLFEHEFPGVAACLPERVRATSIDRLGTELLESGLADTTAAEDDRGYPTAVQRVRDFLAIPEIAQALEACRRGTAGSGGSSAGRSPLVTAAIVLSLLGAVGFAGWWVSRSLPPRAPAAPPRRGSRS